MVYTTHLWWLGGWFIIAIPTVVMISRTGCWKYEYNYTFEQVNRGIYLTLLHSQLSLLVGFFARQDRDTSQDSKKHSISCACHKYICSLVSLSVALLCVCVICMYIICLYKYIYIYVCVCVIVYMYIHPRGIVDLLILLHIQHLLYACICLVSIYLSII